MSNLQKLLNLLLIPLIFALLTPSVLAPTAFAISFDDVDEGDRYYLPIKYLKDEGIIDGYDDNSFRPYENISRAEALKMLMLATGKFNKENIESADLPEEKLFPDTPLLAWYNNYIRQAQEHNVIDGYDDGTFRPQNTINLAESLKVFLEAAEDKNLANLEYQNLEQLVFADTPEGEWYSPYTKYAGSLEMLVISPNNNVLPNQEMTRGHMAEIIYKYLLAQEDYRFGKATFYGSALHGNTTASGEIFDMYAMTAAHKYLPLGTMVQVSNMANGKTINVKINDRGPYGHGRVLDLSEAAFEEIAWRGTGIIHVQYRITHLP
jgi:rare lipoprotein A